MEQSDEAKAEIAGLAKKTQIPAEPLIIMMNSCIVAHASLKQGVPLEDVFVGPERKKLI